MKSPEIRRSLFESEESMGWTNIDLELALQDMFEPVDFHCAEEIRNFFKFYISHFSSLAGHVYRFIYLISWLKRGKFCFFFFLN